MSEALLYLLPLASENVLPRSERGECPGYPGKFLPLGPRGSASILSREACEYGKRRLFNLLPLNSALQPEVNNVNNNK